MLRRLLIVCPHFLPNTSADMHRARLIIPHAHAHGWRVDVLCVDPRDVDGPTDHSLLAQLPNALAIHRVRAPQRIWHRALRMRTLGLRAFSALRQRGDELLAASRFDLIYFASTAFNTFALGPRWLARFGTPFVVDYQDPWINDYYRQHQQRPPGGHLRYAFAQWLARRREPKVIRLARGITSVSPTYLETLKTRYQHLPPTLSIPFGAEHTMSQSTVDSHQRYWTSVGRGGADLIPAAKTLFTTLEDAFARRPELAERLTLRFVGTSYAPPGEGRASIKPAAAPLSVDDLVVESTDRVSFGEAVRLQLESERLIVLLSDDPGYQPSKLAQLVMSGRPLLVVAPERHMIHRDFHGVPGVMLLASGTTNQLNESQLDDLQNPPTRVIWPDALVANFDSARLAGRLFEFFNTLVPARSDHS